LVISVADNGGGLADEAAERLFEPFYPTKSKGMGLGLPIARTIAEQHGGRLAVVNTPGRGLKVSLCLPFARVGDVMP
jgi:signal transduction histidine kinase